MNQCECRTIQILKDQLTKKSDSAQLASTCLKIIEDIRESGLSDHSIGFLHEFLDTVYKDAECSLLDHILEGADCDICKAIANRL